MIPAIVRFLLRVELARLGRRTLGPFDPELSAKIDAVVGAIEALGERA